MEQKKKKRIKWVSIVLGIVVVMALVLLLIWNYYDSKLNMIHYDDGSKPIDTSVSVPVNNDELDIPDLPGLPPEREDGKVEILPGEIYHDEDVINILLLGTDERSKEFSENARADAIMILSLNIENHTIKLVSIERGIGVPVPGRNDDWLTHTFRYGGAALTMQTVRDCFKVDVEQYIRVNLRVFVEAIDAIGGVDIDLSAAECDYINKDIGMPSRPDDILVVTTGINRLNGETALRYARMRAIDSDWKRIERQRKVIQAAINQVKQLSISELNKLVNTILPMVKTNLSKSDITKLLLEVPSFITQGAQMDQMTIPTYETCWNSVGVDGRRLIGVDFNANAAILREFFYGADALENEKNK